MNTYEALLRQRVDPDGALPSVTLTKLGGASDSRRPYTAHTSYERMLSKVLGTYIGSAVLKREGVGNLWFPGWVNVERAYLGKGYGTSLYLAAAGELHESGSSLKSTNGMLAPEAKAIWDRLVEKGVAEVVTEYVREPGDDRFSGGEIRLLTEGQLRGLPPVSADVPTYSN